jgi:two-component system, OmpR family, response regulator
MGELSHVLLVDDDKDILEIARMSLEIVGGLEVTTCENGLAAIEMARQVRPDMILLDVMMPGMDGPTAMKRIRADPATANIPVVLVTARAQTQEVSQFEGLGAAAVIPKPFDPMTLAQEIADIFQDASGGTADTQSGEEADQHTD